MNTNTDTPRGATPSAQSDIEVVRSFLTALADSDPDTALQHLDRDILWHNVSLPKIYGTESVARILRGLRRPDLGFDVLLHHIAGDGSAVLTERTDIVTWKRLRIEFWVCGTFEIEDGKIVVWRDYFSSHNVLWGTIKGLIRAL